MPIIFKTNIEDSSKPIQSIKFQTRSSHRPAMYHDPELINFDYIKGAEPLLSEEKFAVRAEKGISYLVICSYFVYRALIFRNTDKYFNKNKKKARSLCKRCACSRIFI